MAAYDRQMARAEQTDIRLRLMIENPVADVALSLQDKKRQVVDPQTPGNGAVVFEVPVRVRPKDTGWRFYGEHVRSEGPERQFFYIAVGGHAGQRNFTFSRRMKINIHDIEPDLIQEAVNGATLEASVDGTAPDGTPVCASVPLLKPWHVA